VDLETAVYLAPYVLILLVLLTLPLLAQWRWGLLASLTATGAELGLVLFIAYNVGQMPDAPPRPKQGIHWARPDPDGFVKGLAMLFLVIVPGIAALIGGVLSLVWSAVRAARRSRASRPAEPR
jgi:hypothetical protein